MKKVVLLIFSAIVAVPAFSQVSFSAKAGMNFSKETVDYSYYDFKPGYQLGAGIDYYFAEHWGIQTGLTFILKGYKFEGDYYMVEDVPEYAKSRRIIKNDKLLEIPLLLAFRVNLNDDFRLILAAGGYGAYGVGGNHKKTVTRNNGEKYKETTKIYPNDKRWDAGLTSGVTFEYVNKYSIGLFGEWGLVELVESSPDRRHLTYGLNLGYKF